MLFWHKKQCVREKLYYCSRIHSLKPTKIHIVGPKGRTKNCPIRCMKEQQRLTEVISSISLTLLHVSLYVLLPPRRIESRKQEITRGYGLLKQELDYPDVVIVVMLTMMKMMLQVSMRTLQIMTLIEVLNVYTLQSHQGVGS